MVSKLLISHILENIKAHLIKYTQLNLSSKEKQNEIKKNDFKYQRKFNQSN